MTTQKWLFSLKEEGILKESEKEGKLWLHLNAPCKIKISESVTAELKSAYDSEKEIGGMLIATPKKSKEGGYLQIDRVVFIKNVSDDPASKYRMDSEAKKRVLADTFDHSTKKSFPIAFHTHPTHSSNLVHEMMNYVYQMNTSEADQRVSNYGYTNGTINIILPDCLVLCNGKIADKMFVGFYNGMIAPIEFESHRREEISKAMERIFDAISEWAKKEENRLLLFGGGILLLFLLFRFPKAVLPLLLMLSYLIPSLVNANSENPKYFAQIQSGEVTIEIP